MTRRLVLGPPGTGKTTRLLNEMQAALDRGVRPDRIVFASFTRASIRDAKDRACAKFGLTHEDLPLMRTLHSLAFYLLALRRNDVFGREGLALLSEITGEELTGKLELDAPTLGERGDALLFLDQYARSLMISLEDAWHAHGAPIDWFRLKRFTDAYTNLRRSSGLIDFTDMIELVVQQRLTVQADLVLIDEAQDLTTLQWKMVDQVFCNVPEMIIAGDDDQGVYKWAGSSPETLLSFKGDHEVLSQSHRLPRTVWALAAEVAGGIQRRHQKAFSPTDCEGSVEWLGRPEEVDLNDAGTWLLLARTRRQLVGLATMARDQGVVYFHGGRSSVDPAHVEEIRAYETERAGDAARPLWHDALTTIPLDTREYLLSCLRRDSRSLTRPPRVRVETIHGAKGLEADRVLLLTDINARVRQGMELDPDAEQRVLYVGVTRARETLYPVVPQTSGRGYEL